MKESKNLDRLFQEKFRDFEQAPPSSVWSNIEASLEGKKKSKRFIWLWFGGIAAGLALLFSINNLFDAETTTTTTTPVTTDTKEIRKTQPIIESETETTLANTETEINKTNNTPINKTTLPIIAITNTSDKYQKENPVSINSNIVTIEKKHTPSNIAFSSDKKLVEANKITTLNNYKSNDNDETIKVTVEENKKIAVDANETDLAFTDNQNNDVVLKEEKKKKWTVSTVAAPVYMGSFDKNESSIAGDFDENKKQGVFSKAYGVEVAYNVTDRFSVQTGLHLVDYGYKTIGVYVSPTGTLKSIASINYENNSETMEYNDRPEPTPSDMYSTFSMGEKGDITQVFGYIEVPVAAKYKLITGDFGISAIGGFSTLILNKNDIFIQTENFTNRIGSANNLNSLNFSGNLGLELDYKLYKNLHFNLVPMFKAHTSTFEEDTKTFKPYALGIYSGLQFRF